MIVRQSAPDFQVCRFRVMPPSTHLWLRKPPAERGAKAIMTDLEQEAVVSSSFNPSNPPPDAARPLAVEQAAQKGTTVPPNCVVLDPVAIETACAATLCFSQAVQRDRTAGPRLEPVPSRQRAQSENCYDVVVAVEGARDDGPNVRK